MKNYTKDTRESRSMVAEGRYAGALDTFSLPKTGKGDILVHLERGIILQYMGEYLKSAHEFETASSMITAYENRAVVSAEKTFRQGASLVINEKALQYRGKDFEKILIHAFDALDYLMLGNLEDARVEIRQAYHRQKQLYKKHKKAMEEAGSGTRGWENAFRDADTAAFERNRIKAARASSVYQNAFAYYISALVYELNNETDEAYIDLKKAIRAAPKCRYIQQDLIRLAKNLGFHEDVSKWQQKYGEYACPTKGSIDIFVVLESGSAPFLEDMSLPVPFGKGGISFVSFPVYVFVPQTTSACTIRCRGITARTGIVCDIDATAARDLMDKLPILFAKQVARVAVKSQITDAMGDQFGGIGLLASTVASAVTEQADLRTWSSLPKQIQVARIHVPENTAYITIESVPGLNHRRIDIPGGTKHLIVLVRTAKTGLYIQTKSY
ncbi:MAG: hypothetical protein U9P80_10530 [Thermodesulfobacteriota bacterium]|nr:hypothetical protein [Thermodesulfobacteriota bacterium]